jgi:hypothetical protein
LVDAKRITRVDTEGRWEIVFADGSRQIGVMTGLDRVGVDFGGTRAALDLSAAAEISLDLKDEPPRSEFTVVVRDGPKEIYRVTKSNDGALARRSVADVFRVAIKPYTGPKKTIPLPGTIADVVAARGGRMLLLTLRQDKKLAVFDCNSAEIVKVLPLASDNVIVVGTLNHAIVFDRTKNLIERWSLETFKKERTVSTPFNGVVKAAVAGSASMGPILVLWSGQTDALSRVACITSCRPTRCCRSRFPTTRL